MISFFTFITINKRVLEYYGHSDIFDVTDPY